MNKIKIIDTSHLLLILSDFLYVVFLCFSFCVGCRCRCASYCNTNLDKGASYFLVRVGGSSVLNAKTVGKDEAQDSNRKFMILDPSKEIYVSLAMPKPLDGFSSKFSKKYHIPFKN